MVIPKNFISYIICKLPLNVRVMYKKKKKQIIKKYSRVEKLLYSKILYSKSRYVTVVGRVERG